jgi:hypothetical protein
MKDICWTDLLKFFFELKSKEKIPLNVDSIIWYNSSLKIEGKTLFYDLSFAELLPSLFLEVYYPTEN